MISGTWTLRVAFGLSVADLDKPRKCFRQPIRVSFAWPLQDCVSFPSRFESITGILLLGLDPSATSVRDLSGLLKFEAVDGG